MDRHGRRAAEKMQGTRGGATNHNPGEDPTLSSHALGAPSCQGICVLTANADCHSSELVRTL